MPSSSPIITILLILANAVVAYYATYHDRSLKDKYLFDVGAILRDKQYYRLITSGFLHANLGHILVNMLTLYFFGASLEFMFGKVGYLVLYFGSLLGGNFLALFLHRNHLGYRALGASGAVAGVVFAGIMASGGQGSILLYFFLPIPTWLFGLLYIAYSLYGIRSQRDNIGHEAHLGGAVTGLLIAVIWYPILFTAYTWLFFLLVVPVAVFFYLYLTRPEVLRLPGGSMGSFYSYHKKNRQTNNPRRAPFRKVEVMKSPQEELDELLEKVSSKGYDKLTRKEKERLDELSGRLNDKDGNGPKFGSSDRPGRS